MSTYLRSYCKHIKLIINVILCDKTFESSVRKLNATYQNKCLAIGAATHRMSLRLRQSRER